MEQLPVRIMRISEVFQIGDDSLPHPFTAVEFMVGNHGPFTERFRKEEFADSAGVKARLAERARLINALSY